MVSADKDEAELLRCSYVDRGASCTGPVFVFNPGDGPPVSRVFPVQLTDYPPLLSRHPYAQRLAPWITKDATIGNNVATFFGHQSRTCKIIPQGGGLAFNIRNPLEQQLVNAFYLCNWLHDLFLLLGFSESEGNFQLRNYLGSPGSGDQLHVKIFQGPVVGGGKMLAQIDGMPVELRLGTWGEGGFHAALDADIVIHEFVHGVTQRLVGGRLDWTSLQEPQSAAMGEGWSDYFAVTLQNYYRAQPRYVFGSWVSGNPNGVRSSAYDASFPGHYGLLGQPPYRGQHGAGEVWAAALVRLNAYFAVPLGAPRAAHEVAWLLVVDSLKDLPSNPNYIQGRDATLASIAKRAMVFGPELTRKLEQAAWRAFGELGMGRQASSASTSISNGIRADFSF